MNNLLTLCRRFSDAGWKPYMLKEIEGQTVECISYPFPTDDTNAEKARIGIMIREKDDPTTMREYILVEHV